METNLHSQSILSKFAVFMLQLLRHKFQKSVGFQLFRLCDHLQSNRSHYLVHCIVPKADAVISRRNLRGRCLETQMCLNQKVSELKQCLLRNFTGRWGKRKQEFTSIIKSRFFFWPCYPKSRICYLTNYIRQCKFISRYY